MAEETEEQRVQRIKDLKANALNKGATAEEVNTLMGDLSDEGVDPAVVETDKEVGSELEKTPSVSEQVQDIVDETVSVTTDGTEEEQDRFISGVKGVQAPDEDLEPTAKSIQEAPFYDEQQDKFLIPDFKDPESPVLGMVPELKNVSNYSGTVFELMALRASTGNFDSMRQLYDDAVQEVREADDPNKILESELTQVAAQRSTDFLRALRENQVTSMDPESYSDRQEQLRDIDALKEHFSQYVGFTSQMSDAYADQDMDEYRKSQVEAQNYAFGLMRKNLEDQGTWDKFSDIMGTVFWPNMIESVDDLRPNSETFPSMEAIRKSVLSFQNMNPVQQKAVTEELVPNLLEAYDSNGLKASMMLQYFFDPDAARKLSGEFMMDAAAVVDAAGIGMGVAKGLRGARAAKVGEGAIRANTEQGRVVQDLKESFSNPASFNSYQNPEMAGMVNLSAIDPHMDELAGASLMSRSDAIDSVSPVNMSQMPYGNGYVQGISPEQVRIIEGTSVNSRRFRKSSGTRQTQTETANLRARKQKLENDLKAMQARRNAGQITRQIFDDVTSDLKENIRLIQESIDSGLRTTASEVEEAALMMGDVPVSDLSRSIDLAKAQEITPEYVANLQNLAKLEASTPGVQYPRSVNLIQEQRRTNFTDPVADGSTTSTRFEESGSYKAIDEGIRSYNDPNSPERQAVRDIAEGTIKPDTVRASEIERAKKRAVENIQKQYQDAGKLIRNIEFTNVSDAGATARVTYENGMDTKKITFTKNDLGAWFADSSEMRSRTANTMTKLFSPLSRTAGLPEDLVETSTRIGTQASRVQNQLSKVFRDIYKPLAKDEQADLNELLLASDEQDTLFQTADLRAGAIETVSGKRPFNDNVIQAYYKTAAAIDESHKFADYSVRRNLELDGFQEVRYMDQDGGFTRVLGRPEDDYRRFDNEVLANETVLVANNNSFVRAGAVGPYRESYRPVRLLEPKYVKVGKKKVKEGKHPETHQKVEWMLVRDDGSEGRATLKPLPDKVLNKTNGVYVPRIYNPGYHFVRDFSNPRASVLRAFKTKKEADAFIKRAKAEGDQRELVTFQDKDFSEFERLTRQADSFGGLYTGSRRKGLLMVEENGKLQRMDRMAANDSIQRYLNAISDIIPLSEYRTAQIERYKKTVNQLAHEEGLSTGFADPNNWRSELLIGNTNHKVMMEDARNIMINNLNIPTNEESKFQDLMFRIAMMSEGKYGKFGEMTKKTALNFAEGSPVASLKGATFHALLGWFNPRQLYVQAQNASLALSMYPQHALQSSLEAFTMRTAWHATEEAQRRIATRIGADPDEFVDNIRAFKKSGLEDSIRRNADLGSMRNGFGGGGLQKFREAARRGLVFYEEGELISRMTAWNIARRTKKLNKKKFLSDKDIDSLHDETLRLHMNMQKENASWWQTNPLTGNITQFLQVQAKLIENIMPEVLGGTGKWTKQERAQALAGQVLMYGTVGVPLAEEVINRGAQLTGKTPEQIREENPTLSTQVNRGAVGVMAQAMGMNNDFSSAGSILAGLSDNNIVDMVNGITEVVSGGYDEKGAFQTLAGPSLTTVHRTSDALGTTFGAIRDLTYNPTMEQLGDSSMKSLERFAGITSTWNNARKIWQIERMGGITSSAGNMVIREDEIEGWNIQTQMARALGFQTNTEADYWARQDFLRSQKEMERETVEGLMQNYRQLQMDGDLEGYQRDMSRMLAPHDTATQIRLKQNFTERIINPGSKFKEQDRKFFDAYIESGGQVTAPFAAEND